jgi:hypothetical protein
MTKSWVLILSIFMVGTLANATIAQSTVTADAKSKSISKPAKGRTSKASLRKRVDKGTSKHRSNDGGKYTLQQLFHSNDPIKPGTHITVEVHVHFEQDGKDYELSTPHGEFEVVLDDISMDLGKKAHGMNARVYGVLTGKALFGMVMQSDTPLQGHVSSVERSPELQILNFAVLK